jgi:hypothetical protein
LRYTFCINPNGNRAADELKLCEQNADTSHMTPSTKTEGAG